jgi:branched-chain amino acid transport system permease protein
MDDRKNIKFILNIVLLLIIGIFLWWGQDNLSAFYIRILNLSAIFAILGISMNLVLGFTGMFSLGHSGFMCIGAYVAAILSMSPASKEIIYFMEPIVPVLQRCNGQYCRHNCCWYRRCYFRIFNWVPCLALAG